MKKLTVIACLSTALLASGAAQADWRGNWLLGVSGAYNWYEGSLDHSIAFTAPAVGSASFNDQNFDTKGWSWGLLGGYQIRYAEWLFGLEVNVDWNDHDHTKSFSNGFINAAGVQFLDNITGSSDHDTQWGITARIGYEVLPCLIPYIRLGATTHHGDFDVEGQLVSPAAALLGVTGDDDNNSWRFIGGIGAEVPVALPFFNIAGLSLRGEYNYIDGKRRSTTASWVGAGVTGASAFSAREHTNVVKASIVYNFTI